MAPSSDVVIYYRCTTCCECFFNLSEFLSHAERVHCKVLVCQGHDPEENTDNEIVGNIGTNFQALPKPEDHVVERLNIAYEAAALLDPPIVENTCSTEEGEVPPVTVKLEVIDDHSDSESAAGQTTGANNDATLTACYEESEYQMQAHNTENMINPMVDGKYYNPLSTYMTTEDVLSLVDGKMPYDCRTTSGGNDLSRQTDHHPSSSRASHKNYRQIYPKLLHPTASLNAASAHGGLHMTTESQSSATDQSMSIASNRLAQSSTSICVFEQPQQEYAQHTGGCNPVVKSAAFTCPICQKVVKGQKLLLRHLRMHTEDRPYKCTLCASAFKHSSSLAVHRRVHTGEKPFKCAVCSSAFTKCSNLLFHRKIHTGEKPYVCTCGSAFNHPSNLKRHKATACKI